MFASLYHRSMCSRVFFPRVQGPPLPSGSIGALLATARNTIRLNRRAATLSLALLVLPASFISLHPPPAALDSGACFAGLLPRRLNRRAAALPLASLVSPASFTPPISLHLAQSSHCFAPLALLVSPASSASLHPPQAALRLRSHWRGRRSGAKGGARFRSLFRQPPPPTTQSARCCAAACIACFAVSYASLHPPLAAFGFGTSLHPSIWLNRRAVSLPLASLVSPASFTPPISLHLAQSSHCFAPLALLVSPASSASLHPPQAALRLRSHWRGRRSGATGGASATEPWSSQGGYEECREELTRRASAASLKPA